jgi:UDP-N-acetylglucosamine 2-epimerase (non-hydrolysing)
LIEALTQLGRALPVVFPVHPRTRKMIAEAGFGSRLEGAEGLRLLEPLGYLEFLSLTSQAKLVLTDSGGLQEETTALGVPCLTLRDSTERPVTVTIGTSQLVGTDPVAILREAEQVLDGHGKRGRIPDLWDGRTAPRIAELYEKALLPEG